MFILRCKLIKISDLPAVPKIGLTWPHVVAAKLSSLALEGNQCFGPNLFIATYN